MVMNVVKRITKAEKDALKQDILDYAEKHGSFCINSLSQTFGKKWETINTSVQDLLTEGRIYVITGTQNPRMYTIWPDQDQKRARKTVLATLKERESERLSGENSGIYARPGSPHRRASSPEDIQRRVGFVCHPQTKSKNVDIEYVRAHWQGSVAVDVIMRGQMLESWKLDGEAVTGSWTVTPMSGNYSCTGRIHIEGDPEPFSVNALTRKDGSISSLKVHVHPRFVYYKASDRTAVEEFRHQVADVIRPLESMGWQFGEIRIDGRVKNLHRALNSIRLGMIAMQSTTYEDKDTDMVHFDRSHGTPEAEVYGASDEANATVEYLANPLPTITGLTARIEGVEGVLDKMDTALEKITIGLGSLTEVLGQVMGCLVQQGEIAVKMVENSAQEYAPTPLEDNGIAYGRVRQ